jgi:hypothetical protein
MDAVSLRPYDKYSPKVSKKNRDRVPIFGQKTSRGLTGKTDGQFEFPSQHRISYQSTQITGHVNVHKMAAAQDSGQLKN